MGKFDSLIDAETSAKPAPAAPKYGALIEEETSSAPLSSSLFSASGTNPDEEAKKIKLSKELNTPAAVLPNDAEQQAQLKKLDADVIQQTSPATAKFLTNEDNARVTGVKGVDKLIKTEQAYKTYNPDNIKKFIENYTATGKPASEAVQRLSVMKKNGINLETELNPYTRSTEDYFKDPIKSAAGGANIMVAGFVEVATPINRIHTALLTALSPTLGKAKLEGDEAVQQLLNENVEFWQGQKSPAMQKLTDDFNKAGIADSVMMLMANPSLVVDQLSQSTPYLLPGAGAARGGEAAMVSFNVFTEAADAANTARQEAIAAGQTREQQDKAATIAALVAAPLVFLGNKLTGVGKLEADFLTKGSTGQKLLSAVVKEAISGSVEEGSNQFGTNVAAAQYDDSRQLLEGVGKAAVIGGILESTHAAGMVGAERALNTFVRDTEQVTKMVAASNATASQAVAAHDTIEQMSAMTADNELRTRAPEAFQEFIETMTDEQELQEVYVSGQAVLDAVEANDLAFVNAQPELFARIQEAASLGHDVQLSVGEYLTHFAGGPLEETLLPELKAEAGGATYKEAQEFYNKQAELFQSEVQAVAEQNEPVLSREEFNAVKNDEVIAQTQRKNGETLTELPATYEEYVAQHKNKREVYARDVEAVETKIFDEFQKAGRFTSSVNRAYATPLVEFYKTQAKNFGVTPSQMYEQYPLRVQAFLNLVPGSAELQQYDMAAPLTGAPSTSVVPNDIVRGLAKKYAEQSGITSSPQVNYVKADPVRGKRIADEYEAMGHKPNDPEVKAAYRALIDETLAQYQLVKELGLNIEFIEQGQADPYPEGPRQAIEDIRNGHLWVFPTDSGFGSSGQQYAGNPLLEVTKEKIGDRVLLANDVFRIVHDVFGHAKDGVGFGANGEENAWQSHVRMYSPLAARAMTTETRGQNSWVNFGPFGKANRIDPRNTTYADQKTGLLPEWVSTEGIDNPNRVTPEMVGSLPESTVVNQGAAKVGQVSIRGVHFSKEQRSTLNGGYYGTGIKGAEADRLRQAKDGRIKQRLYFYVDEGKGVFPEYGVGNAKHVVDLPNMYDGARNPLKLPTRNVDGERDMNVFESAVIDAGFDGYYIESAFGRQGAAVLLGDASRNVKVNEPAEVFQSVAVRRGTESLKRFGLDPDKTYTTREVAAALEARQRKKFGKIDDKDTSPEAAKRIASWMTEEVLFEMENRDGSAVGWYSTKFQEAIDILAQDGAPELLTDPNARALLTALVAITSDGQKVVSNMAQAMEIYKNFFKTDKLEPTRSHNRQASVDGNLAALQDLFELLGPEEVHDFLLQEKTVKELGAIAKDKGIPFNANYSPDTKLPMAAVIFGPKLGAFYANLMGKEGYLTMDRWWVRTFNRYRGTLLTKATAKSLADFRELLGQPDLSDDETISVASTYEAKYRASGYKAKTPLNKLGNTIHRATFGVKQVPERTSDRTFMIETTRKAKEMLARKGIDMSIADIQATLWYYEKRLYGELGARDSADISYADAARRIVALDGDYSTLSDGDVERLSDRLSVGEELYQSGVDQTQTREFKNWFGDSKVVDAEGKPLVVYHGTSYDFDTFSRDKAGATTQADNAKLGFFFTNEKGIANVYSMMGTGGQENVMPVYLSMKNPLVVNSKTLKDADRDLLMSFWKNKEFDGAIMNIGDRLENKQTVYMVRNPEQIKSAVGNSGAFDPNNPSLVAQGTRGSMNLDTLTMTLLQGADLSTVIHESGHFYLEVLEDLANRTDAPQQVQDDFQKTMEWFGVTSAQWAQMSLEQQRPYHEQWAESFERWNLEGAAPTQQLQPVFSRFRAWLVSVYKSVEEFVRLNPAAGKLNDEVRGVFSRLLASAEAIEATEQARAYQPLFGSAEEAGVSQNAFNDYVNLGKQATQDAMDSLQARSMRDMKWLSNARNKALKELQATAKAARALVFTDVTNEVTSEPIYQAMRFLRTGETKDPNTGDVIKATEGFKLDTEAVKAMYPESALDNPDLTKLRGMTSSDGLHPDLVAQMFGLTSGDALVRELTTAENMRDKIAGLTDQRMLEEHGDLVDERSIQRAADEAVHNEARAKFMATGLKMLSKSPISVTQMTKAAKNAAENVISNKRVRDIKPKQYTAAESRANKEVLKLAAKSPEKAAEQQRVALLNNRLAAAAQDAVTEVEKALRYLSKFNNEGTRKNLDIDYLEQIDALLEPFDLRKGLSLTTIDQRASLAEWVQNQEAMGFEPTVDPVAMAEARQKSYKNMPMTELRALVDTIKQIEHMGRMKQKLLTAIDKAAFAERIAEAKLSMALNSNRIVPETGTPSDVAGQLGQWVRQMLASHRKFTSFMRELDGGHNNGVLFNLLVRPMAFAGNTETAMKAQAAERLATLFKPVMKKMSTFGNIHATRRVVPGTEISMTHEQRVMFAMNWGNEGNRQRLLDGGITGKKAMSEAEARAVLDTLTKDEWDFVQGVWDFIGEYKPLIAAQERELTGKTPEWIEPSEVETKFGVYPGGYFPAKYDTVLSTRSDSLEAVTDLRSAMKGAFGSSAARNGYTKARAAQVVGRPLLLNFNAVSRHVNEVIHRLAWQAWLVDANRVVRALDNDFRTYLGAEPTQEIQMAIRDIAQGDAPASGPLEVFLNRVRTGTSIVGMGWSISTAALQPTGLSQAMARVGGRHMAKGLAQYLANPMAASDWVNEHSTLMSNRGRTMTREMNEILNTVRGGEKTSMLTASFFYLIGKMQRIVDIPTYIGAYERALEDQHYESAESEEERKSIEASARAVAEQTVVDTQGGGEMKDLARVQRGSPIFKLFTNFYSYMSTVYNLNVENFRKTSFSSPSEFGVYVAETILINFVPVVMAVALKNALKGQCEWDDLECLAQRYKSEQVSHVFGQMVGLREIGVSVDVLTGGEAYGYSGPAGLRFFVDVYKASQQALQGEADLPLFKAVNNMLGALFHYPAGQINKTVEGAIAIENGEVEGAAILPALIAGPPK